MAEQPLFPVKLGQYGRAWITQFGFGSRWSNLQKRRTFMQGVGFWQKESHDSVENEPTSICLELVRPMLQQWQNRWKF